jgi:hypothetical protein
MVDALHEKMLVLAGDLPVETPMAADLAGEREP